MNSTKFKYLLLISTMVFALNTKAEQLKIVCIGNSISQGKNVYTTGTDFENLKYKGYRTFLWTMLDSAGYDVDFVGYNPYYFNEGTDLNNINYTINVPVSPYTGHTFPRYHECYWGINTISFMAGIENTSGGHPVIPDFETRLTTYDAPNIALIHIGTNKDIHQDSVQITTRNIKTIITTLRNRNPNTTIFLAKLTTEWSKVNTLIPSIASEMTSPQSPVILVDQSVVYPSDPEKGFTWDWVHPTDKWARLMAKEWYKAITQNINTQISKHEFKAINIYPNPTSSHFKITANETLNISVFDTDGKLLMLISNYISENKIDINNLKRGIYIVKAEATDGVKNIKLIVN